MKTVDFLDAVRRHYALTSDYQLAKKLGWSTARIALYRTTSRELDDDACLKVADLLEIPAPYVMACIAAARAKSTEARRAWEKAAKMLKSGTAAVLLAATLLTAGEPSSRAEGASAPSVYYDKPKDVPVRRVRRSEPSRRWRPRRRGEIRAVA